MIVLPLCYACLYFPFVTYDCTFPLLRVLVLSLCYACLYFPFVTRACTSPLLRVLVFPLCYACLYFPFVTRACISPLLRVFVFPLCYACLYFPFVTRACISPLLRVLVRPICYVCLLRVLSDIQCYACSSPPVVHMLAVPVFPNSVTWVMYTFRPPCVTPNFVPRLLHAPPVPPCCAPATRSTACGSCSPRAS